MFLTNESTTTIKTPVFNGTKNPVPPCTKQKGKEMATKNNYKNVKAYEDRMINEKNLKRQKVWIPNTQHHRKTILDFASNMREEYLATRESNGKDT